MNHGEAMTVTEMILRSWPQSKLWTAEEMTAYATGLQRYDAHLCVQAVAAAQQKLHYRPSVAELREFYDIERAKLRAQEQAPSRWPAKRETVPLWVRRWVAARYLHKMFGREQDMRRFKEQGDWGNPYADLMPAGEWLDEAAHVTEDRVWNTLRG